MQLSLIIPPALKELSLTELATWAAGAGFAAIDAEVEWQPTNAEAVRAAGIAPGPMRIRASLADSDPTTRRAACDEACAAIDHALTLGLRTVWTLPRNFRNDRSQRDNYAAALESLRIVAAHAERQGVRVAIENCPFDGQNVICTPEAWDALFAALPSDALGLCMDPSHCVWQGIDWLRATREYAQRIYHVHAKDAEVVQEGLYRFGVEGPQLGDPGQEDGWPRHGWWRHRLPGLGAVDWNAFISTLADQRYDGTVTIEHEDPLWGGSAARVQRGLANGCAHLAQFIAP